jgi:hypothetical protein
VSASEIIISPVASAQDKRAFIDLPYRLYAQNPNWVPPLKDEVSGLITPGKNPWFEHGEMQLFLARRGDTVVGRISAHIDHLALQQPPEQGMGPGVGNWGLFEATDATTAAALIATAEGWLRDKGMTQSLGPISLSIWDEPGLLIDGYDHPPTVMMGYNASLKPQDMKALKICTIMTCGLMLIFLNSPIALSPWERKTNASGSAVLIRQNSVLKRHSSLAF